MNRYKFEVQNCITKEVDAESKEEARLLLIDNLHLVADEMVNGNCHVSEGEVVKNEL